MALNKISAGDPILESIPISECLSYVERIGWTRIDHPNDRITLLEGPLDDQGTALQLILPRDHNQEDANARLADALNLLTVVHLVPLDFVIASIGLENKGRNFIGKRIYQPGPRLRFSTNPIFSLVLGAFLMGAVGAYLVSYHYAKQTQLQLNTIRVSGVAEVWSKVSAYETTVAETLQEITVRIQNDDLRSGSGYDGQLLVPSGNDLKKAYEQSDHLRKELLESLDKNRFWLGEEAYTSVKSYVDGTLDYYFVVKSGSGTEEMEHKRSQAKLDLDQKREKILKG